MLDVYIIGAGLSGLAAAISLADSNHSIHVIEAASQIAEIGAGLQITPNASKILQSFKLPEAFWATGSEPSRLTVHRYDGTILARQDSFRDKIRKRYGAPFIDMHRADLQRALVERARELGVKFSLGEKVQNIDTSEAKAVIKTGSGKSYEADLVVAADGLWSRARECFVGRKADPLPTGDLAYRIVLSAADVHDEELKRWIRNPEVHFWIGPGSHVVGYSMKGGDVYNIVLLCPDSLPQGVARQEGSVDEMKALFTGWDPILTRFLSHVQVVDKWKLMHREEMDNWVSKSGNLVFVGDACHPMLPYLAQGANSSIEDGAVLGLLVKNVKSTDELPSTLHLYESLRKTRGETIVKETFRQRHDFHMVNGPEQVARDQLFSNRLGREDETDEPFPSRWTCPVVQPWLYGYDAEKEVEQALQKRADNGLPARTAST